MAGLNIFKSLVKKERKSFKLKPKCRVIAPLSQKGGATKSTSCVNIASVLCEMGYRVLVIDLDQQGHSTMGLGGDNLNWEYTMAMSLIMKKLWKTLIQSLLKGHLSKLFLILRQAVAFGLLAPTLRMKNLVRLTIMIPIKSCYLVKN